MSEIKWPKLKRDHVGCTVKTIKPIRNGWGEIPLGTICTVTYSRNGLSLDSDLCACCGLTASVSRVDYASVELLSVND